MTEYFPYASVVEVLQLLIAVLGLGVGFWRLWVSVQNGLAVTGTFDNDLRLFVAESAILDEVVRLFKLGVLVFLGVISILLPPPHMYVEVQEQLQGLLLRIGLMILTCVMVFNSIYQEYRRQQFVAKAESYNGADRRRRPAPPVDHA